MEDIEEAGDDRLKRLLVAALGEREVVATISKIISDQFRSEISTLRTELGLCKQAIQQRDQ